MDGDHAIVAGMFTLIGGYLIHSYRESIAMRTEYRKRCERLENDLGTVHKELDSWQEKYFNLTVENGHLQNKVRALQIQLQDITAKFVPDEKRRIYQNG